jgi:hypothetical protein
MSGASSVQAGETALAAHFPDRKKLPPLVGPRHDPLKHFARDKPGWKLAALLVDRFPDLPFQSRHPGRRGAAVPLEMKLNKVILIGNLGCEPHVKPVLGEPRHATVFAREPGGAGRVALPDGIHRFQRW